MTDEERLRREAAHRAIARVRHLGHTSAGIETRKSLLAIERRMLELADLWTVAT